MDNKDNAHSYLKKIRDAEVSIHNKELELEALRYKASGAGAIRYDKDKVQTSPQDYLAMAMADIFEITEQIEEDKASVDEMKCNAYSIVRRMDAPEQRALIEWYYLNGIDMTITAEHLHMSERNAYYLRDDALESFGRLLTA